MQIHHLAVVVVFMLITICKKSVAILYTANLSLKPPEFKATCVKRPPKVHFSL